MVGEYVIIWGHCLDWEFACVADEFNDKPRWYSDNGVPIADMWSPV